MSSDREEALKHLKTQTGLLAQIYQTLQRIEAQQGASSAYQWTPEGLPICPRHNEVMGRREKQGDVWYSHRVIDPETGEEMFCKGYRSRSSPGWSIDTNDDDDDPPPPPAPAIIRPMDLQRTTQAQSRQETPPNVASEARGPIATKTEGTPREVFYAIGSKAVESGSLGWDKFNSIVSKASRDGYEAGISELRMVVG